MAPTFRVMVSIGQAVVGLGWEAMVYSWYRGASVGERTGMITKVSFKGSPMCRYWSIEMKVGAQPGTATLGADAWEFTVDSAYEWLIPKLQEAAEKIREVTVVYRQDTTDVEAKARAPAKNLPWRFCVTTSYHATGVK